MNTASSDWNKADFDSMNQFLMDTDWLSLLDNRVVETNWNAFKHRMLEAEEMFVPMKKRRASHQPPWMTRDLLRQVRKKRRLWKNYRNYSNPDNYEKYKKIENEVKNGIKKAKRNYEKKIAANSKKNPKMFYGYISSKKSNKVSVGPLKSGGVLLTESLDIANRLNDHFSSVFTRDSEDDPVPEAPTLDIIHPLAEVNFPTDIIIEKLKKLKTFSSAGPDNIRAKILKETSENVALPLSIIFKQSLSTGQVPEDWKLANITPIYKKSSKFAAENYRPVSLTSIVCKIMEAIIKDHLVSYLQTNNLIRPTQHGFMSRKSCLTNLLEYLETVSKIIDDGSSADVIYLDFSKAFDKVSHQRLKQILQVHGITGPVLNWITSWLKDRKQRVRLKDSFSIWMEVLSGVPQGSVLGPLLFVIFINLIDSALSDSASFISKFADDTKVGRKILSLADSNELQTGLTQLVEWSNDWKMVFNADKCKVVHFGKRNPCNGYTMQNITLKSVDFEKDVGVLIHNSLKPSLQCNTAAKKANQVLGQMSRSLSYRDKNTWISLYKMYVRPHLEYCVQAWNPWTLKDIAVLENVQKRAVRMVSGLQGHTYEEKLAEVGLTTLEERRTRGDLIQVWKVLHNYDDVKNCWFTMASESVRETRLSSSPWNITVPIVATDIRRNFFTIRVINFWNNLPEHVKSARTLNLYKNYYDQWQSNQMSQNI